jgi:ribosomal protein L11 methyltransferase
VSKPEAVGMIRVRSRRSPASSPAAGRARKPAGWRLEIRLASAAHCAPFEAALAPLAAATAVRLDDRDRSGSVSAFFADEPDRAELGVRLALAAASLGIAPPRPTLVIVPDADWVRKSQARFPPVVAGRFEVRGSHVRSRLAPERIAIRLDAGAAFGTGRHESTRGCLVALDRLGPRHRPRRMLDLGCGSGILAIAMAKLWSGDVIAADVDPIAVEVAAANARDNGVAERIRACVSRGFANPALRGRPFDVIAANILAAPLVRMAPALAGRLARGGVAILSGLLVAQRAAVVAAYARAGLAPADEVALGEWTTVVLRRRPRSRAAA